MTSHKLSNAPQAARAPKATSGAASPSESILGQARGDPEIGRAEIDAAAAAWEADLDELGIELLKCTTMGRRSVCQAELSHAYSLAVNRAKRCAPKE